MITNRSAVLRGIAVHAPSETLTNGDLRTLNPTWDMDWVERRIGLTSRRVASGTVTASDLAYGAAESLLSTLAIARDQIDYLIFVTQTPDYFLPASACVLQHRLGLSTSTAAFDMNQGCAGYVYGLDLARSLVLSGSAQNVLLLTGDTLTRALEPADKSVRVLFGDAGSASLISAMGEGATLGQAVLGTDGSGAAHIMIEDGAFRSDVGSDSSGDAPCKPPRLRMDGQAVLAFAMQRVPLLLEALTARTGVAVADVRMVILHQANALINDRLRTRLKMSQDQMPIHFDGYGNTSSCTIPIALSGCHERLAARDRVVLCGFGVGLSWGTMLVDWSPIPVVITSADRLSERVPA